MPLTVNGIPAPRSVPTNPSAPPAHAQALINGLRPMIDVSYRPLHDTVARFDTTMPRWRLYLDSDSPAEDHCWVLLDVLKVLTLGADAETSAIHSPRLRLVPDRNEQ